MLQKGLNSENTLSRQAQKDPYGNTPGSSKGSFLATVVSERENCLLSLDAREFEGEEAVLVYFEGEVRSLKPSDVHKVHQIVRVDRLDYLNLGESQQGGTPLTWLIVRAEVNSSIVEQI